MQVNPVAVMHPAQTSLLDEVLTSLGIEHTVVELFKKIFDNANIESVKTETKGPEGDCTTVRIRLENEVKRIVDNTKLCIPKVVKFYVVRGPTNIIFSQNGWVAPYEENRWGRNVWTLIKKVDARLLLAIHPVSSETFGLVRRVVGPGIVQSVTDYTRKIKRYPAS